MGIFLIDPKFSLLTTDIIEIPFESARAAVSGSLFMDGSPGVCVVSTPSFEGDVLGLIDSALNDGNGGRNCMPEVGESGSFDPSVNIGNSLSSATATSSWF